MNGPGHWNVCYSLIDLGFATSVRSFKIEKGDSCVFIVNTKEEFKGTCHIKA